MDFALLMQLARNTVRQSHFAKPTPFLVENFATEALAISINADWRPIERLFRDLPAFASPITGVEAATQQRVYGPPNESGARELGILDLLLWVDHPDGAHSEVWVEVKAGSPATSKQLRVYSYAANHASVRSSRDLVVLSTGWPPVPPECIPPFRPYTWATLEELITLQDSPEWRGLRAFLRRRKIVTGESVADPIPGLVDVLYEALRQTEDIRGSRRSPRSGPWHRRQSIRTELLGHAVQESAQVVRLWSPHSVQLDVGLSARHGGRRLAVELGFAQDYPMRHEALRRLAADASLGAPWKLVGVRSDDGVAEASIDWPFDGGADAAIGWVVDRVTDLRSHGLLVDLDDDGRVVKRHANLVERGAAPWDEAPE